MGYVSCAAVYLNSSITALNRRTRGKLSKHWIVMLLCVSEICRLLYWKGTSAQNCLLCTPRLLRSHYLELHGGDLHLETGAEKQTDHKFAEFCFGELACK